MRVRGVYTLHHDDIIANLTNDVRDLVLDKEAHGHHWIANTEGERIDKAVNSSLMCVCVGAFEKTTVA